MVKIPIENKSSRLSFAFLTAKKNPLRSIYSQTNNNHNKTYITRDCRPAKWRSGQRKNGKRNRAA